ncbi:hypothetical protein DEU56DRAFT_843059 [Suillus clintonianus]|uniref:uncharacterized protein n=1 Tax=Suillus clintonianus TaxID=1904413 RepID=UPI001B864F96|nr:uncharacterized protein DEU56DRAFT_843059 [Suillus clintonianus]KAG2112079.1 hypothetical protein DEU56DRAFT_843059 [Suillus clintonianus]
MKLYTLCQCGDALVLLRLSLAARDIFSLHLDGIEALSFRHRLVDRSSEAHASSLSDKYVLQSWVNADNFFKFNEVGDLTLVF